MTHPEFMDLLGSGGRIASWVIQRFLIKQRYAMSFFLSYSTIHGRAKIVGLEPSVGSYYARIGESVIHGDVTIQGGRINITNSLIHGQTILSGIVILNNCHLEGDITYVGKRRLEDIHWWSNIP